MQVPPVSAFMLFTGYEFTVARLPSALAFTVLTLFNVLRFPLIVLPKALRALSGARPVVCACARCLRCWQRHCGPPSNAQLVAATLGWHGASG